MQVMGSWAARKVQASLLALAVLGGAGVVYVRASSLPKREFGRSPVEFSPQSPTYFGASRTWADASYRGERGTFFADVDGDGRADGIAVTAESVRVRRSTGSDFAPAENWTSDPYFGDRGTYVADVNGDGRTDVIAVNSDYTWVRTSAGSGFAGATRWTNEPYHGDRGTFFADVDGDKRADAVVANSNGIVVRRAILEWQASACGPDGLCRMSQVWRFGAYETWADAFSGERGTFVGDVNGDGRADAVAVNRSEIVVRPSTGSAFGSGSPWGSPLYLSSRATIRCFEPCEPEPSDVVKELMLQDVNGDGLGDLIDVRGNGVHVSHSTGSQLLGPVNVSTSVGETLTTFAAVGQGRKANLLLGDPGGVSVSTPTGATSPIGCPQYDRRGAAGEPLAWGDAVSLEPRLGFNFGGTTRKVYLAPYAALGGVTPIELGVTWKRDGTGIDLRLPDERPFAGSSVADALLGRKMPPYQFVIVYPAAVSGAPDLHCASPPMTIDRRWDVNLLANAVSELFSVALSAAAPAGDPCAVQRALSLGARRISATLQPCEQLTSTVVRKQLPQDLPFPYTPGSELEMLLRGMAACGSACPPGAPRLDLGWFLSGLPANQFSEPLRSAGRFLPPSPGQAVGIVSGWVLPDFVADDSSVVKDFRLTVDALATGLPHVNGNLLVEQLGAVISQAPVVVPSVVVALKQRAYPDWSISSTGQEALVLVRPQAGVGAGIALSHDNGTSFTGVKDLLAAQLRVATSTLAVLGRNVNNLRAAAPAFPSMPYLSDLDWMSARLAELFDDPNRHLVISGEQRRGKLDLPGCSSTSWWHHCWGSDISSLWMMGVPDGGRTELKLYDCEFGREVSATEWRCGNNSYANMLAVGMAPGHLASSYETIHESAFACNAQATAAQPNGFRSDPAVPSPGNFQEGRFYGYPGRFSGQYFGNVAGSFEWAVRSTGPAYQAIPDRYCW